MQSSITAWLKKPAAAVKKDSAAIELPKETNPDAIKRIESSGSPSAPPLPEEQTTPNQQDHELSKPEPSGSSGTSVAQAAAAAEKLPSSPLSKPPLAFTTAASSSSPPPLIPNITLEPCTPALLPSFKRLNTLLFPIPYPPKFYAEILSDPTIKSLTLLAIWRDNPSSKTTTTTSTTTTTTTATLPHPGRVIGGIRCRLLGNTAIAGATPTSLKNTHHHAPKPLLYISTICVLSPYRNYGIATHLLDAVTAAAINEHGVGAVGAHVWVDNDGGRRWYRNRGFKEVHVEEGYYSRLVPAAACVVRRDVGVGDLLGRRRRG